MFCSRFSKSRGRANPNTRYHGVNDRFFEHVDTEAKAYFLGWIASDGAIRPTTISIYVHEKDVGTLTVLRDLVCPELPIKRKKNTPLRGFTINSVGIATDVCRRLDISPGKKDAVVAFPDLGDDKLTWAFVRGLFDGDGSVASIDAELRRATKGWPSPRCSLASSSPRMLDGLTEFVKIPAYRGKGGLEWNGTNALDFLGKLYRGASYSLTRKRDLYLDWCTWAPSLSGGNVGGKYPLFRWARTLPSAVAPSKERASDSGFDLTLVAREKEQGLVVFYRTGIRVQPAFGWYFDLVPRSSISKTGYMLANGVGVIDRAYVGEILVPLIKIDPSAPDLQLPARLVQIIPRQIIAAELVEVDELGGTARGEGGFGSTGR